MKKENMNNKGFSLVELIIVIAIMAILIVVLAPQYLKYVEKSRVSSDQTTVVEYINAMQVLASDPDVQLDNTKAYTLTNGTRTEGSKTIKTVKTTTDLANLLVAEGMLDAATAASSDLQSTAYGSATISIELKYDSSKKVWQVKEGASSGVDISGRIKSAGGGTPTP